MTNKSFGDDEEICKANNYPLDFRKIALWAKDNCYDRHGNFHPSRAIVEFKSSFHRAAGGFQMKTTNALGKQVKKFVDCINKPLSLKTVLGKKFKIAKGIPTKYHKRDSDDDDDESNDEREDDDDDDESVVVDDEEDDSVELFLVEDAVEDGLKTGARSSSEKDAVKRVKAVAKLVDAVVTEDYSESNELSLDVLELIRKLVSLKPRSEKGNIIRMMFGLKALKRQTSSSTSEVVTVKTQNKTNEKKSVKHSASGMSPAAVPEKRKDKVVITKEVIFYFFLDNNLALLFV